MTDAVEFYGTLIAVNQVLQSMRVGWSPSSSPSTPARCSRRLQNLGWAAGYNVVAIPLAAGVLASEGLPYGGLTLSPAVGAILMSASTIVVALNAQTLRRVDLTPAPLAS